MAEGLPEIPLAERMRPHSLSDLVGQEHLTGPDGPFSQMVAQGLLPSMILWGPPGVGKTTLGRMLAALTQREFRALNAISAGVKEVREAIEWAEKGSLWRQGKKPVVFIDEIHRFNKGQQDALLAAVEKGTFCLIGATTENPGFEVNAALLSRCQLMVLKPLEAEALQRVISHALERDEWLKSLAVTVEETEALMVLSGGDARRLLNILEMAAMAAVRQQPAQITNALVRQVALHHIGRYDKTGEQHYDIISAFIKSIRGSDPQAGVYWLARMLNAGEDPVFIARRLVILASEDIGNANPNALLMAQTGMEAVKAIGMPEARIILSQVVIFLASSAKSNASYLAIGAALKTVQETGDLEVPLHLRNAPVTLMKELGYGAGYAYPHDFPGHFTPQDYLPEALKNTLFYVPAQNPREEEMRRFLAARWPEKYEAPS